MMTINQSIWKPLWVAGLAAVGLTVGAATASGQALGTFAWQLQPYCNRVTVNVVQTGAVYTMDGWDDQCGATTRAPLVGTATLNPDGSVGFGLNITTTPGGAAVTVDATISIASLSGTWRDSAGHTGTFAFGAATGGSPRPAAVPTGSGDITGVAAGTGLTGGGTSGDVTLGIAPGGVSASHLAPNAVDSSNVVDGTIGVSDINQSQVQTRVAGTCAAGQAVRTIGQDGTVTCEPVASGAGDITAVTAGTGLTGGATTGDATLAIATAFQLPQACANGQVAKANGTGGWTCATDNTGGGITSITAEAPLTGGTITSSGTIGLGTPAAGTVLAGNGSSAPGFTNSPFVSGNLTVGGYLATFGNLTTDGSVSAGGGVFATRSMTVNNENPVFNASLTLNQFADGTGGGATFDGYRSGGTLLSPTNTTVGMGLANFSGRGRSDSASYQGASMRMFAAEDWGTGAHGAGIAFWTTSNGSLLPVERLQITHDGLVGIGVGTPTRAKVEINGGFGSAPLAGAYAALFSNGVGTNSNGTAVTPSLWASNYLVSPGYYAFSDARIKRVVGPSNAAADLATLLKIGVTDYTFIDTVAKGTDTHKKVIAQELEQVYPQAVTRTTDVVPDIFQMAPVTDGWVTLVTNLAPGERVRLIGATTAGVYEVLEVAGGRFRTALVADGDEVFVYGREVDDFRNVDYEAITMLNVSATQALHRRLEEQATHIAELEMQAGELAALKLELAELRAVLTATRTDATGVAAPKAPQDR